MTATPSFRISAISGDGCRELTQKLQEALDRLPRVSPAAVPDSCRRAHFRTISSKTGKPPEMATTRTASARRMVIKVGSALVTNNGEGLDLAAIDEWARQIAELCANRQAGHSRLFRSDCLRPATSGLEQTPARRARTAGGGGCRPDGTGTGV
jgi:hypothetical protein